jgi:hypothetical protein
MRQTPPLVRRLVSPTGFLLAGLCFLLPFVTVSCSSDNEGQHVEVTLSYTGVDLVTGGRVNYHLESTGGTGGTQRIDEPNLRRSPGSNTPIPPVPVEPFAVAVVTLIGVGIAVGLIWDTAVRRVAAGAVGMVAAVLLVGAGLRARSEAARELQPYVGQQSYERVHDMVDFGLGFWLALAALLAVGLGNLAWYVWRPPPHTGGVGGPEPVPVDHAWPHVGRS